MAIKDWPASSFPASQDADPITGTMPNLDDESAPGANDGDEARSSQVERSRDKLQEVCKTVGADDLSPDGSIRGKNWLNSDYIEKAVPIAADRLLVEDSADGFAKKWVETGNLPGGGGGSPLTTKGDLFGRGVIDARIPVGNDGEVLRADSGEALGVKWNPMDTATRQANIIEITDGNPAGNIEDAAWPAWTLIMPEAGELMFDVPWTGWWHVCWTMDLYATGTVSDAFKLVFDEGDANEQVIPTNANADPWENHGWQNRDTASDYAQPTFVDEVYLTAGQHGVKGYFAGVDNAAGRINSDVSKSHAPVLTLTPLVGPGGTVAKRPDSFFISMWDDALGSTTSTVGQQFYPRKECRIVGVRYRDVDVVNPHTLKASLWEGVGAVAVATGTLTVTAAGTYEVLFDTPYDVSANKVGTLYTVGIWNETGAHTASSFAAPGNLSDTARVIGEAWYVENRAKYYNLNAYARPTTGHANNVYPVDPIIEIPASTYKQLADTKRPTISRASNSTITVAAAPGDTLARRTLQDGKQRSFIGTLTWDITADLDTGAEAVDTWYYLYLYPKSTDDDLLDVVGSVTGPTTGPTGVGSNWEYIGAVRNDNGSNLKAFDQDDAHFQWRDQLDGDLILKYEVAVNLGVGAWVNDTAALATAIPATVAGSVDISGFIDSDGAGDYHQVFFAPGNPPTFTPSVVPGFNMETGMQFMMISNNVSINGFKTYLLFDGTLSHYWSRSDNDVDYGFYAMGWTDKWLRS